jgi:imidazole glycerol phosphate synthase glutamine amidotransferase subunit
MKTVVIAATGRANTASLVSAFRRLGVQPVISDDPERVENAEYAVLPGVGAFGPVASRLQACGLLQAFKRRATAGHSTLGVCLGMQLFFSASEESPGAEGMRFLPSVVRSLDKSLPLPQFGWNRVQARGECTPDDGWAYFANSYCVSDEPAGWQVSLSRYGQNFAASLERGRVLLCQYHPELSGAFGLTVLRRWLALGRLV